MARATVLKHEGASVVVDDSWPGIVFASWFGEASVTLVDHYYDCHESVLARARGARTKFVLVTDTFGAGRPSPAARKRIADRFAALGPDAKDITVATYIIIENALLRGVVTALAWLDPRLESSVTVASPAAAIEGATAVLKTQG